MLRSKVIDGDRSDARAKNELVNKCAIEGDKWRYVSPFPSCFSLLAYTIGGDHSIAVAEHYACLEIVIAKTIEINTVLIKALMSIDDACHILHGSSKPRINCHLLLLACLYLLF